MRVRATQISKDPLVRRSNARSKLLSAGLIAGLVAVLSGIPAVAGTSSDAELTDVAGDGNFINGQGAQSGHETGPDTRPASFDNVDLRAVWFETAYSTTKVRDAAGNVLRVEHAPTALVIRVQTQAPARPMSPLWQAVRYEVAVTLPGCKAFFRAYFTETGSPVYTPGTDSSSINPLGGTRCGDGGGITSPVPPTFDGPISTMTFPLAYLTTSKYISEGTAIRQPSAASFANIPGNPGLHPDETGIGRDFTIGQDVPPDIDCSADPTNSECDS
jgi:hypothetical protein